MPITKKDERWLSLAAKVSKCSSHNRYKIAAILVKGGRLLAVGINKDASPKRFTNPHRKNMRLHAEIDCLIGISKESSKDSTLYVKGQTFAGGIMNVSPCQTCLGMIESMQVRRIVYQDMNQIREIK